MIMVRHCKTNAILWDSTPPVQGKTLTCSLCPQGERGEPGPTGAAGAQGAQVSWQ